MNRTEILLLAFLCLSVVVILVLLIVIYNISRKNIRSIPEIPTSNFPDKTNEYNKYTLDRLRRRLDSVDKKQVDTFTDGEMREAELRKRLRELTGRT